MEHGQTLHVSVGAPGHRSRGAEASPDHPPRVALVGNPNTGKTTTFNALTGLRHKTSNFPGTTVEARLGSAPLGGQVGAAEIIDLPGIYSLELEHLESSICREVLAGRATPQGEPLAEPDAVCVLLDATNLPRNLTLLGEVLRRRLPTVVAVNMIDLAAKAQISVDCTALARAVGCAVVPICAKSGEGVPKLRELMAETLHTGVVPTFTPPGDEPGLRAWAHATFARVVTLGKPSAGNRAGLDPLADTTTDRIDRVLTHPIAGSLVFAAVMAVLFFAIFSLAKLPMDLIGSVFGTLGDSVAGLLPQGLLSDLLVHGVIAGVGSTVIFLPQILLLFFLIGLLEDTGYLARGAFVMDRLLRPFGLPGHSFVPLLSSHACALPGIMSTRCIPDPKERLATILVAPFMTCSARLPVYVLLAGVLFPANPLAAALAFIGCYVLGIAAGVLSALVARRTILRGRARPMALELPSYKVPSLRTAAINTFDRGLVFLKKAGTVILCICIVLWWLGAFPHVNPPAEAVSLRAAAEQLRADLPSAPSAQSAPVAPATPATPANPAAQPADPIPADPIPADSTPATTSDSIEHKIATMESEADRLEHRHAKASSFLGTIGRTIQPVLSPIGVDWQLTIGIVASFAAREVFVGTMSVVVAGAEEGDDEQENRRIRETLAGALRDDGKTLVFNRPTSWALLVFYVLAMQCLPTLAVTARESGHVKWAFLQLGWMSAVAFIAATLTYQLAVAFAA